MGLKLDEKRGFGTVYGDTKVAFVQDEKLFGPDKQEIYQVKAPEPVRLEPADKWAKARE